MGCTASRLEDEEAVQLCKDRKKFIKQALEQRSRFASGHIAYIQSLKRVSHALRDHVNGDGHYDLFSDPYTTPPFTPVKRLSPELISIPIKSSISASNKSQKNTCRVSKYLSGGNPSVSVEEWPRSPETVRVQSYYSTDHYGIDGFFATQPLDSSSPSPYNRPSYPAASPRNSQWDFFWNPFSSLDTYAYPYQNSYDAMINDDDIAGLRQVREAEGIPELEEEDNEDIQEEEEYLEVDFTHEGHDKADSNHSKVNDAVENSSKARLKANIQQEVKEFHSKGVENIEVSEPQDTVELEVTKQKEVLGKIEAAGETPGFTVYLNPRPASMPEIVKVIENEFVRICDCAHEVSIMLEASRVQYSSSSTEITVKMLNPVALFRSASSRSTSSRFFLASSSSRDDGYESSSDCSDDSCMISGSHQSTLDRLYAWEKKLYQEVKAGERIRIAFEKKCMILKSQDVNGEESSTVDKTRRAIRDLHTRLKVSIHSVESVSKRIERLRDEELQPQLMELMHGLARMWRATADCHQIQKRAVDEAKLLVLSSSAAKKSVELPTLALPRQLRSAAALEAELRNWRSCLGAWIAAQRSYARALAGWILRCGDPDGGGARSPLSPRRSSGGAPPVLGVCVQWSRLLDSVGEAQVLDGLDFFAAGMASVSGKGEVGSEAAEVEPAVTTEFAGRVLWAGMSVAVSSLADFAGRSAEGYDLLVKRGPAAEAETAGAIKG